MSVCKKRANSKEDKEQRRRMLLDAALELFRRDSSSSTLPSVIEIAEACQLAKGTVYLYFKTKEEIFTALLEGMLGEFNCHLCDVLDTLTYKDTEQFCETMVNAACEYLDTHPDLLNLITLQHNVLECNLHPGKTLLFISELSRQQMLVGERLDECVPHLRHGDGARLIWRTHALLCGLSQLITPPKKLAEIYAKLNAPYFSRGLIPEFRDSMLAVWRGSLTKGSGALPGL